MGRIGFHMRMEPDLHASVMEMANGLDVSMNELINTILADFVGMDDMYILRLKVERLDNEIIGYEIHVPRELQNG